MHYSNAAHPILAILIGLIFTIHANPGPSQVDILSANPATLSLSRHKDHTTIDRIFEREDVVYIKIEAPTINFAGLVVNEFSLDPDNLSPQIKSSFVHQFDGTYTAQFDPGETSTSAIEWRLTALLADDQGNKIESEVMFIVGDPSADGIEIEISGVVEEIGVHSFTFLGRTVFVSEHVEVISEKGEQLQMKDLRVGDVANALLQISGEGDAFKLTALHIIKEEKSKAELTG